MRKIDISTPTYPNTFALVDDEDYEVLSSHKWRSEARKGYTSYAVRQHRLHPKTRKGYRVWVGMHRFVMNCPAGMEVDHMDGNGLNNQKANLRICTRRQNSSNRLRRKGSGYKGVHPYDGGKKWIVTITVDYKNINLGMFTCEKAAARCYDAVAKLAFGEFARLNFPEDSDA